MASVEKAILWIHGDCLNPNNLAFQRYPNAPAVWVWDDAYLQRSGLSLKRILFIYECLLELPVAIYRGHVVTEVAAFAQAHGAQTVVTMDSPAPGFARICQGLRQRGLPLQLIESEPFVTLPETVNLRRFSRYWRKAVIALQEAT